MAHGVRSCGTRGQELWYTGSGAVAHGVRSCGTRGQELWYTGSGAVVHGVRSCGTRGQEFGTVAYLPQGMWDLPGSGMELAPPTLAAEFLPTEPPGKPLGIL